MERETGSKNFFKNLMKLFMYKINFLNGITHFVFVNILVSEQMTISEFN